MSQEDEDRLADRIHRAAVQHGLSFPGGQKELRECLREADRLGYERAIADADVLLNPPVVIVEGGR